MININTLKYKNFTGSIEFSNEDGVFFGKVSGIPSLISYEGATMAELIEDFRGAVDDYLAMSEEEQFEESSGFAVKAVAL